MTRSPSAGSLFHQPEVPGEDPGLSESITGTQGDDVLTSTKRRVRHRQRGPATHRLSLGLPPEVVHRIQFRCGPGKNATRNPQLLGLLEPPRRLRLSRPILEEHAVPAPPVG